ncbi:thrombospondin type-1 domain-containing protein 7B isoform X2 [Silurus meridionalis]|uniref:thrombospondin type-1 domain-containing protein 7B isoform X2 n=1 Tax=Silurus meridionalis TaxID=175797 RepID=UPI001EEAF76D|nr:thrombospondin type-1 domain-containing protein 7B isoform X2 [Silurus meridionalis]
MMSKDGLCAVFWPQRAGKLLLLSLSLVLLHTNITFSKNTHYSWKTGQWGRCKGEECGSSGVQSRSVWCVHSDGWHTHHSNCLHSVRPDIQRTCFKVCEWHQDLFEWDVSEWSSCSLAANSNDLRTRAPAPECITAQHGVQRRSVRCVRMLNGTSVSDRICEFFSPRPPLEQACLIPCPLDCVVSDFSLWSRCSGTCGLGSRHRTRHVLAAPAYGGAECPSLSETQPCDHTLPCPIDEDRNLYSLKVGAWTECRLPQKKDMLLNERTPLDFGLKERNMVKRHVQMGRYQPTHYAPQHHHHDQTQQHRYVYQDQTHRIHQERRQHYQDQLLHKHQHQQQFQQNPVYRDQTQEQSQWQDYQNHPQQYRNQNHLQHQQQDQTYPQNHLHQPHHNQIQQDEQHYHEDQTQVHQNQFRLRQDQNQVPQHQNQHQVDHQNQTYQYHHRLQLHIQPHMPQLWHSKDPVLWDVEIGFQTRQVRCMAGDGNNSVLSLCWGNKDLATSRSCIMVRDCGTSDWSSWSSCSKTCQSSDLSPGYRVRSRTVVQPSVGGGRECSALQEKEACNIIGDLLPKCPRYEWRSTDWSDCRVTPLLSHQEKKAVNISALCGGGVQSRDSYCVQVQDETIPRQRRDVSRPVSVSLCEDTLVPSSVRSCSLACSQPCLLTQWSSWGPCLPEDCSQGRRGYRERRRRVLGEGSGISIDCGHVLEFIPCEDPVCFQWRVEDEGACRANEGTCGSGVRRRSVTCVNSEGVVVEAGLCEETPPPVEVVCEVACPGDCVISSWSDWSPCSQSCAKKNTEGKQSRSRIILASPGQGGKLCPPAPSLEEWRSCNNNPCVVFYWEASPWSPCVPDPSVSLNRSDASNHTLSCSAGLQTRKVTCMKINGAAVTAKRCPDSARLDSVQSCVLPCKRDCVVTLFSEWTVCPHTCLPANSTTPTQSRYRMVVQRAAGGGQECPDTLFEERECEPLPLCPTYRWRPHKWQACTLVPDSLRQGTLGEVETCGRGLEKRALSCVNENDEPVGMSECVQWAGPMPPQVQSCWISCKDDCTFSPWSKFSECSGCEGTRTRKRTVTGRSRKRERCLKEDVYPLVESEPCVCDKLISEPWGNWSVCILPKAPATLSPNGWRGEKEVIECGEGKHYHAMACLDQSGRLLDPSHCAETDLQEETCSIPCPLDCRLSSWSPWSPCSVSCGSGLRVRSRWLREKPFNGGRPCPKLDLKNQVSEVVPCRGVCAVYQWVTESWSFCSINTVDEGSTCGEGVQSRKIRCVLHGDGVNESHSVNDSLCDQDDVPAQARTCTLPCPDDCVMSPWSHWSSCPMSCDANSVRTRTRQMLRPPSAHATCPGRNETEPCAFNANCFNYQYNVSGWSSCMLSEHAVCGEGTRIRLLDCIRSDSKLVDLSVCDELALSQPWTLSEACRVDCPISCMLSEWTQWTECSHSCGNQGVTSRSRRVLQEAHEEGRPCPSQLSQTKPCPIRPCYSWLLGDWSSCYVEGAECGDGVRRRNLSCVVHWGHWPKSGGPRPDVYAPVLQVDNEKCNEQFGTENEPELQQPCFIPCPGDCHLTDWSLWSSCQLTCVEGRSFEVEGHQARSRAVIVQTLENQESCPDQEIETRPCKGGKCHSYEWKTSSWSDNVREVWCQRSDGVNVTGGCLAVNKPTSVRHCHPPCTKPFSHCKQSGVCGCEKGYTEVMNTHGFLDYCTRTPGGAGDTRKADVKSSSGRVKPGPSQIHDFFGEWSLQALSPDGRIKMWVYGATGGGFILILFIITVSFLFCSRPVKQSNSPPLQKALSLAYDGDVDM